jgi:myxalamid-type polyketide synthase MxaB
MTVIEPQVLWDQEEAKRQLTLPQIVAAHAAERPEAVGFTFLGDGENITDELTFGELHRQALALAGQLRKYRGGQALLIYASTADFVVSLMACLRAGVVAVHAPLVPANEIHRMAERAEVVSKDCDAQVVLTPEILIRQRDQFMAPDNSLADLPWLASDTVAKSSDPALGEELPEPAIGDVGVIQYTSGSTGTARGIPLTQEQLVLQSCGMHCGLGSTPETVTVGWTPLFHDLGLFANVLSPIYTGYRSVVIPPLDFLRRPSRWVQAISRFRALASGGPNFAYAVAVAKVTPEEREGLDLSCWKAAWMGAEPLQPATLDAFAQTYEPYGFSESAFKPGYGLAEATCSVAGRRTGQGAGIRRFDRAALDKGEAVEAPDGQRVVSAGFRLAKQDWRIVDIDRQTALPKGRLGELWIRSRAVSTGYWNRPESEQEAFRGYLADTGDGPFLRTGDIGFLFDDEELFIVGRLKDLIIIRGRNIFPQDIEATVQASHPDLRQGCGAAFSVPDAGTETLVVMQEVERDSQADPELIREAIRTAVQNHHAVLAEHIVLLPPGAVPKTSSGKLRRNECRGRFLAGTAPMPAPAS